MAIVRLSIEVLKGARDSDTDEERAAAVAQLNDLQAAIKGLPGMIVYDNEETAPWGVPNRPDTFNVDFDTALAGELGPDAAALDSITQFLLTRGE